MPTTEIPTRTIDDYPPGREKAHYWPLLGPFFERVAAQERALVDAGYPADGITAFLHRWFDAWNTIDVDALRDCWAEDLVWTMSQTHGHEFRGREMTVNLCKALYPLTSEVAFCPMDNKLRAQPYFDFSTGSLRITLPWSVFMKFKWWIPYVGRRTIRGSGIDRYEMRLVDDEWKIARIDTDWDMAQIAPQLLPIPLPARWTRPDTSLIEVPGVPSARRRRSVPAAR